MIKEFTIKIDVPGDFEEGHCENGCPFWYQDRIGDHCTLDPKNRNPLCELINLNHQREGQP